jgi:hypothetical protein
VVAAAVTAYPSVYDATGVPVGASGVVQMARSLRQLGAAGGLWAPGTFTAHRRRRAEHAGSYWLAVDVDTTPKRPVGGGAEGPALLEALRRGGCHLGHLTPHGARGAVWLGRRAGTTEATLRARALHARVQAHLTVPDTAVDPMAAYPTQLMRAPRPDAELYIWPGQVPPVAVAAATTAGPVVAAAAAVAGAADYPALVAHTGAPARGFAEAAALFRAAHPHTFLPVGYEDRCPACGGGESFGHTGRRDSSRWVCFSTKHAATRVGRPQAEGRCWHGDLLDLHALRLRWPPGALLRLYGYLAT